MKSKKYIILSFIPAILLSLGVAGCGEDSPSTAAGGSHPSSAPGASAASSTAAKTENGGPKFVNGKLTSDFKLKVPSNWVYDFTMADKKGFFKEVGIVPEDTGAIRSGTLLQTVIQGQNHLMGSGHVINIAAARKAGAKIKIVQTAMVDNPDEDKGHMYLFVQDNGKINTPKDLTGKKIAVSGLGSCGELLVSEYLRQNGIARDKVEFVVMEDQQQEQALRKGGQIDAAFLHAAYAMEARSRPGLKTLVSSYQIGEAAGNGEAGGLAIRAFSEDFIAKYPDVIKAYIVANYRAQQWSNEHFEESKKIYAEQQGVAKSGGNWHPKDKWVDEKKIQFWIDLMVKNGFAKEGEINVKDLYTNDLNPFYTGEIKE
ncbi:MAG: hypothetical protein K0Q90_882 [Paenibacillaceae bacterium]|jgi:ABC-type nitrate/sulfonate/bicarbonate transport system substrate-binding protein|nr:hypothetical protein [Paenibacillaceae bacterium]